MFLREEENNNIVYFEGEINLNTVKVFKEDLIKVASETDKHVILNFNNVSYINSLGLGAIIELYKKLRMNKKNLKIVCNNPAMREMFEVVKFNKLIPICENDEEAF